MGSPWVETRNGASTELGAGRPRPGRSHLSCQGSHRGCYENHLKMRGKVFCKLLYKGKIFWSLALGEVLP